MVWLLVAYLVALAAVLLQPQPTVASGAVLRLEEGLALLGAPERLLAPGRVEAALNALMVVPAAALAALAWRDVAWTAWPTLGFALSCLVETVQGLALPGRSAEAVDVVANTAGVLVGGLAVSLCRQLCFHDKDT